MAGQRLHRVHPFRFNLQCAKQSLKVSFNFNAIIIILLIPLALRGVQYRPIGAGPLLARSLLIYGVGGIIAPFIGIKLIDLVLEAVGLI